LSIVGADVGHLSDVFLIAGIRYRLGAEFRRAHKRSVMRLNPNDAKGFKEGA
jgi:hypothetical protein